VIYTPKENVKEKKSKKKKKKKKKKGFKDTIKKKSTAGVGEGGVVEGFNVNVAKKFEVGAVKSLIHTRVGDGPRVLGDEETLLGPDGLPKTLA